MAKQDENKVEEVKTKEKPKEKSAMQQRSFFGDIGRDLKNIGVGLVALPAHIATNPLDMAGKAALIAASAIPVVGGIVTAAYVAKSSYRETGHVGRTVLKAALAGVVAGFVPGTGAAMITGLAAKNIGEQIEQKVNASVKAGVPKSTLGAIADKYGQALDNVKGLRDPGRRQQIGKDIKNLFSKEGIEAIRKTIGPLTAKGLKKQNEQMIEQAPNLAAANTPAPQSKIEKIDKKIDELKQDVKNSKVGQAIVDVKEKIDELEKDVKGSKVVKAIGKAEKKIDGLKQDVKGSYEAKKSELGQRIGQLGTHIQTEARGIRDALKEKIEQRKGNPQQGTSAQKKPDNKDKGQIIR